MEGFEMMFFVPDTREGWVEGLKLVLEAYFKGSFLPVFDYSLIRPEGAPIKTFGGKASGHKPLEKLYNQIMRKFRNRANTYITSTDIVDIMNMIGACVVAGNVRRSAQLVIGDPADDQYLKLKDYHWSGTEYIGSASDRAEYGWTSNNSINATIGMNYEELAKQTAKNGEPGYIWMDNVRKYSRMSQPIDNKDGKAVGTNPCGEQTLESFEMCCLVETFPTRCTDLEDYKRTLKFAYLYGKTVTLSRTHWIETNRVMLRNRRIGTSVSGIAQFIDKHGLNELKTWLNEGYNTIQHYDKIYSDWLAVPKSIKTTSIKPSGTVSLLAGVTPGIHYPESTYYIRRIRLAKNSDLLDSIIKAGYKVENSVEDPINTLVVEIPIALKDVRSLNEVSMWEQLNLASFIQEHWADNQVSCTITFTKEEAKDIAKALNYFQYKLKAISFLPKTEIGVYAQMPYEEITEEMYNNLIKNIQPLNIQNITEDSKPELYCDSSSCSIN